MPTLPSAFHRLAWSNLAAQSAEQIGLAASPILAVVAVGAGAGETGWLQTAQTLPFLLFAIPAGLIADRASRRRLMTAAEAVRALSLVAILVLAVSGGLNGPWLAGLGFLGACGTVAYGVAAPALVPALVPSGGLGPANARLELGRTVAFTAGPALGGALVGWTGGGPAFGLAAGLSLAAVALLAGLDEPPRPVRPASRLAADLAEGIRFVGRHRLLRPIFAGQIVFNTAFFAMQAVYAPYAIGTLGLSPAAVGGTLAVYGVGMVAGALAAPRLMATLPFGVVIGIGPVSAVLASLAMVATRWGPGVPLAVVAFFLVGIGPILWSISTTTLRQAVTPPALLGRVSAIILVTWGARAVGAAIGAIVGGAYGAHAALIASAALFAICAAMILISPVVRLARQPDPVAA